MSWQLKLADSDISTPDTISHHTGCRPNNTAYGIPHCVCKPVYDLLCTPYESSVVSWGVSISILDYLSYFKWIQQIFASVGIWLAAVLVDYNNFSRCLTGLSSLLCFTGAYYFVESKMVYKYAGFGCKSEYRDCGEDGENNIPLFLNWQSWIENGFKLFSERLHSH